jgi:cytochrome P450
MRYGPAWRAHRRALHQHMNVNTVDVTRPAQLAHARRLLAALLTTPADFYVHVRR